MNIKIVAENLKRIRKAKKKTQSEISELTGISNVYLSNLENGIKKNPSVDILTKIATVLGVSIDDLLKDANAEEINEEMQEVQSDYLNEKDKKDIAKDLDNLMGKLDKQEDGPVYYEGKELKEEDKELFKDALELALKTIKIRNKEKYNPNKNKK